MEGDKSIQNTGFRWKEGSNKKGIKKKNNKYGGLTKTGDRRVEETQDSGQKGQWKGCADCMYTTEFFSLYLHFRYTYTPSVPARESVSSPPLQLHSLPSTTSHLCIY